MSRDTDQELKRQTLLMERVSAELIIPLKVKDKNMKKKRICSILGPLKMISLNE